MATNLPHIHELLQLHGEVYLDVLLTKKIVVNIKVDQVAFVVKRDKNGFAFYGKDGKSQITNTKRASTDLYEEPISYIKDSLAYHLPFGTEVYLEYFTDKIDMSTKYNYKPSGKLMISYVKYNDNVLLPDDPFVELISSILGVARPPILFSGELTKEQRSGIIAFAKAHSTQTYSKEKFVKFMRDTFKHSEELDWLTETNYEGIVIYFSSGPHTATKVVDPGFTTEKKQEKAEMYGPYEKARDLSLLTHLPSAFETALVYYNPYVGKLDDNYIDFVSFLFETLLRESSSEIQRRLEPFLEYKSNHRKRTSLTLDLLPDFMKELSARYWWADDVFAQLISLLRTKRANARILLSKHGDEQAKAWRTMLDNMIDRMNANGIKSS